MSFVSMVIGVPSVTQTEMEREEEKTTTSGNPIQ